MKASPPNPATASELAQLPYALSADTSPIVNPFAVSSTSGTNWGQSAALLSRIRTAVTTFIFTPQVMWHFTHTVCFHSFPYLWSNHVSDRLDPKPDESTAESVSTARRGARSRLQAA